jgi:hypothetical protein
MGRAGQERRAIPTAALTQNRQDFRTLAFSGLHPGKTG